MLLSEYSASFNTYFPYDFSKLSLLVLHSTTIFEDTKPMIIRIRRETGRVGKRHK
jgi:hypothetical protein